VAEELFVSWVQCKGYVMMEDGRLFMGLHTTGLQCTLKWITHHVKWNLVLGTLKQSRAEQERKLVTPISKKVPLNKDY